MKPTQQMIPIVFFFFVSLHVSASPMPATSSSALISGKDNIIYSEKGFTLNSNGTNWESVPTVDEESLVARFEPGDIQKSRNASLTVRVDKVQQHIQAKTYVDRWSKDYQRLGFEVLGKKNFQIKKQQGLLIDLKHPITKRQVRQAIFLKKNQAVILTCRDNLDTFNTSIKDCNQIIRSFQWTLQ